MGELFWRPMSYLLRRLGWEQLVSLILLFLLGITATMGIGSVLRDIRPVALLPFVLLAVLVSWILHSLQVPAWLAALVLPGSGALSIFIVVGRLSQPALNLIQSIQALRISGSITTGWQFEIGSFIAAWQTLSAAIQGLFFRMSAWFSGLLSNQTVFDPLASAMVWSLGAWLLAAWLGWFVLRRKNVFLGLLPMVSLFSWVQYYTRAEIHLLLVMLGLGCILHVLTRHFRMMSRWNSANLVTPDNLSALFLAITFMVSGLTFTAWAITSINFQKVEETVSRWFQPEAPLVSMSESAGETLGLQVQPSDSRGFFGNAWDPTLPSQHLLTGGPELSETVVMWVSLGGGAEDATAAFDAPAPQRPYWRSLAYNRYSGRGWFSDDTVLTEYPAGEILNGDEEGNITLKPHEQLIQQEFRIFRPDGGAVYYTGELITVDRDYVIAWRRVEQMGDELGVVIDENSYQAISREPVVGMDALRVAGTNYPNWVRTRYLSVPEQLPQRVRSLALDLTASQPTPFDRALAIESYLRSTYTYTLDLPPLPARGDLVDYFIFELKQGYCDYFASAMVVLSRAAGLPSRLVTGYVGGTWDAQNGRFIVTEAEAHSWAEIYFPGFGWIRFEPTASLPALDRSDFTEPDSLNLDETYTLRTPLNFKSWTEEAMAIYGQIRGWLWLFSAGIVFILLNLDRWRLFSQSPEETVARVYYRIYQQAFYLRVTPGPGGTLSEFSSHLIQVLREIADWGWWQHDLDRLADDVLSLSALYEQALFSPQPLVRADQKRCFRTWQRMRARFWLARVLQRAWKSNAYGETASVKL